MTLYDSSMDLQQQLSQVDSATRNVEREIRKVEEEIHNVTDKLCKVEDLLLADTAQQTEGYPTL